MPHVTVTVNGKNFRMACDAGQEDHLIGLADRMNDAIEGLRETFGEIGDLRLTVMASILMTDKLDEAERRIAAGEDKARTLTGERDAALAKNGELEALFVDQLETVRSRVDALAGDLNGARPPVESDTTNA
ncbi:MAG: cell division protein ZapA [Alphaproteobacteria bacterium]